MTKPQRVDMTLPSSTPKIIPEKFYGRRMGRPLRQTGQGLVETLLPQLRYSHTPFQKPENDLWLEIGFGGGEHLCAQAKANPHVNFIGAEAFLNGVSLFLQEIDQTTLTNVRIFDNDVRPLLDTLATGCVAQVFLLFPDPWPKARHHKRRFVNQQNLARFARLLKTGGKLRIATDHADYRTWIIDHLKDYPDFKPLFSWDDLPITRPDGAVQTRYESKALAKGSLCTYMDFVKEPSA